MFFTDNISPYFEFVKSERGGELLVSNGYTFSRCSKFVWRCSTNYPFCKAKLRMCKGQVIYEHFEHSHPRRTLKILNYTKSYSDRIWTLHYTTKNI